MPEIKVKKINSDIKIKVKGTPNAETKAIIEEVALAKMKTESQQKQAQNTVTKFQNFIKSYNSFIENGATYGVKPLVSASGKQWSDPITSAKAYSNYQAKVKSFRNQAQELKSELKKYSSYYNDEYVTELRDVLENVSKSKPLSQDEYNQIYYNPTRAKGYSQEALIKLKNDIKFSKETAASETSTLKEKIEASKTDNDVAKNVGAFNPYVSGNQNISNGAWLENYKFVLSQMDYGELKAELNAINSTKAVDGLNDARLAVKQAIAIKDSVRFSEKYKDFLKDANYQDVQDAIADLRVKTSKLSLSGREELSREVAWLKNVGESLMTYEDAQRELDKTKNENGYSNNEYWKSKVYSLKYAEIVSKLDEDIVEDAKNYRGIDKFVSDYGSVKETDTGVLSKLQKLGYSEKESKNIIDYIKTQEETEKNKAKLEKIKTNYSNQNWLGKTALVASTVATNLVGMVPTAAGTIFNMYKEILSSEYVPANAYADEYQISNRGRAIRNSLSEDIGNEAVDFLAQTGLSIVDWLAIMALTMGAGQALGMSATAASNTALGMMSANAGASAALDTLEKGGNYTQASVIGILTAATEILTEKIALDSWMSILTNKTGIKNSIVKSLIQQGASEMGEETLAQVANFAVDAVVMGDESDYQRNIQAFIDKGYDEKTARSKAILALGGQVVLAGLGGFLSGAAIGSSTSFIVNAANNFALNTTGNNVIANNKVDSLVNIAEKYNVETELDLTDSKTVGKIWSETKQAIVKELQNIDENGTAQVVQALTNEQTVIHSSEELTADMEQLDSLVIPSDVTTTNTDNIATETDAGQSVETGSSKNIDKNNFADNVAADMPEQETNGAIEVDGNVFFTDEADSAFTELSASSPQDATPLQRAVGEMYGNPVLTEDQKTIKSIGKKLGWKIQFDNVYVKDAQGNYVLDAKGRRIRANADIDFKNRTITIDFNCKKPVEFLIKHELTDYISQNRAVFFDLMNTVMDSGEFSEWVKSKNFASVQDMVADVIEKRLAAGDPNFVGKSQNDLEIEARIEITSDFIGEKCFGGPKSLDGLLKALQPEQRKNFIQRFLDFLRSIRDRIAGNKTLEDDITRIEKQFVKAYRAVEVSQQQKNTDQNGGVRYAINNVEISDVEIQQNIKEIAQMDAVSTLSGNEFAKGEKDLVTQVDEYFSTFDNSVENAVLGDVDITYRGAKDSISHGVGRNKAIAFAAVPVVIKQGKIIDYQVNWKNRGYDTVVLAAPITIKNAPYYVGVIILRDSKTQRFYLHEVITERRTDMSFKTGTNKVGNPGDTSSPSIISLLDKIREVKEKMIISENTVLPYEDSVHRYSITPETQLDLFEKYKSGEITEDEYRRIISSEKVLNPNEIANLTEKDANTTPKLEKQKGTNKGNKVSNVYGSLLGSSIFDDAFREEITDDTYIRNYQSVTNRETLAKAARELDEGGEAYVKRWNNLDVEHASLIDIAVGLILMDRYQRVGDYESAATAAERVRMFGTASGQQVQIFSILGRLNPETMAIYAQKELTKAFEIMVQRKTQKWINANAEKFQLNNEDIDFIRRRTLQAAKLPEGSRSKEILIAEIATRIQDKLPPKSGQALKAYQRISMLLNAKTNIRNFTSNATGVVMFTFSDVFGAAIDKGVVHHYGSEYEVQRTKGLYGYGGLKDNFTAFKEGFTEAYDDFKRKINTRNYSGRFDIGDGKSFNEHHTNKIAKAIGMDKVSKTFNDLDRITSFLLDAGDRPFYKMWFINSLNNQMKLNKVNEPSAKMIELATQEALERTWQDNNAWTNSVTKVKGVFNTLNFHKLFPDLPDYGLGDVIVKFTKTPANLAKAIFDFSPVGLVQTIAHDAVLFDRAVKKGKYDPEMQRKLVDDLAKGISGTIIQFLLFGLSALGWIKLTGKNDDDDDVKNFESYIQGKPEYSISIFGSPYFSYEWNQPFGAFMATIADFMQEKEANPNNTAFDNILAGLVSGGDILLRQSFLKSLENFFATEGLYGKFVAALTDDPSVYVPQLIAQVANITDEYSRNTYIPGNSFKTTLNKFANKVPGLRQTLEKRVDVLGRDVPNSQHNWFNAFFNPANTYTDTSTAVTDGVYQLYKQTGAKSVIPRTAPYDVTAKGNTHKMTAEERADFQRISGSISSEMLEIAFKDSKYKKLTDSQKVKLVAKVYEFATAYAKSNLDYDYNMLSAMVGEKLNGDALLDKELYNKLNDEAKQLLVQEYYLSKTEMRYIDDYEGLIEYYIKQVQK